jgi:hypothetical protein
MTINLPHFDTKLQALTNIKEQVKNSLAEYLFPDTEFAVGHIYENSTTSKELEIYEEMTPQFSNGKKVYFGSSEVREKVYPNMSDGAAYGSLVFTPCKEFKELKNLRVLVVDDATGENGGIIAKEQAKRLVGDCYGRMSPDIARYLTGATNTPIQFRMGIKPQSGNEVHRIAKGTLAPSRVLVNLGQPQLSRTPDGSLKTKTGYDLVLATSSFKGRLDESALLPGEHSLTVGVGVKTRAEYGKQSLGTQILVNYPKGVEVDILPKIEAAAKAVADKQSDPRKIAQYFIEKHERLLRLKEQNLPDIEPDELIDFEGIEIAFGSGDELESEADPAQGNEQLYELLKACTDSHPQLLEHPFVVDKLTDLLRKEWVDIATGRAIEFQAGLAQPSLELLQDEICVPYIPEGEKLIVTRSPLINSNGVIILTNKHLPEFSQEQGTVHIHPKTAVAYLQADFDGDRLAYERASLYPTLAAEIEEKHLPGQKHTDVIKADKEKYVASSFAEIALAASSNKIGIIANNIQQAVAIENEISELPEDKKLDFLFGLKGACIDLISFRVETFDIPDAKKDQCLAIQEKAEIIAGFAEPENYNITKENVNELLLIAKQIFFETTDILSNELQTAADGAKSAARPNEQVLDFALGLLKAREVAWISDKKSDEVYSERIMETQNYSPVDKMINATNQMWQDHHLESLPTHQFKNFFPKNYTPAQEETAKEIIKTYNNLYREAFALKDQAAQEPGIQMIATSEKSGKQVIIENLLKYNHPDLKSESLNIKLEKDVRSKNLMASAQCKDDPSQWKKLGVVSAQSIKEHGLQDGFKLTNAKTELTEGITDQQIKAKFKEARIFAEQVRNEHSLQSQQIQSAIWHSAHASNQKGYAHYSRESVAFNIFPEIVAELAKEFQFTDITLAGMHQPTNEWGQELNNKTVEFTVALETRVDHPNYNKRVLLVEGKQVAPITETSYQLPIGTTGKATLTPAKSASLTATTAKGNTLKIGQLKNYDFNGQNFSQEPAKITLDFATLPGKNTPVPVAKVGDKVLGVIDPNDREKLKAAGILKPGTQLNTTLQSKPATTATLSIDKESLKYPETWIRKADASKQAWIQTNLKSPSHTVEPVSPEKPYERPKWEQHLVKAALRTLNNVQPNEFGERMAVMGQTLVTYTDNEQGRTLKVIDLNHQGRGILYKAEAGKAPIVDNFTLAEKQQLADQVIPQKTKSDTLSR